MSANNVYVVKYDENTRQWYGWDETAESTGESVLSLKFSEAPYHGDTRMELEKAMEEDYTIFAEYGYATDFLPKDGTPIEYQD